MYKYPSSLLLSIGSHVLNILGKCTAFQYHRDGQTYSPIMTCSLGQLHCSYSPRRVVERKTMFWSLKQKPYLPALSPGCLPKGD